MIHIWKHFKTITSHRLKVMKYCFKVGLYFQGLTHDLSKYSWTEFSEGCRYYQGDRSPNNKAREETGISKAWLHHKGRNKHHYEYWVDYDFNSPHFLSGLDMPRKYIAEMVIDRICACEVYQKEKYTQRSAYEYYLKGTNKLWFISDNTKRDLEMLLLMVAEEGRDETFKYIKNVYLKNAETCNRVLEHKELHHCEDKLL
jgi:hypothetical protein